jgi:hypothetical protein
VKNHLEGMARLEAVEQLLASTGYQCVHRGWKKPSQRFTKSGSPSVTVTSHRGVVTQAEFERIRVILRPHETRDTSPPS